MTDQNVLYGLLGTSAPTLGVLISFTEMEAWLRIISMLIGIAIGLVSFYNLIKKK